MPITSVSKDGKWVLPSSKVIYEIAMKHSRRIQEESEVDRITREVNQEQARARTYRQVNDALNELLMAAIDFRDASNGKTWEETVNKLREAALNLPSQITLDTKIRQA